MTDLSHWDVCDEFSGYEAASLFVGIDPNVALENTECQPMLARMKAAYTKALHAFLDEQSLTDIVDGYPTKGMRFLHGSTDYRFFEHMEEEVRNAMYASEFLYSWRMTSYFQQEDETWKDGKPTERQLMLLELAEDSFSRWLRRGMDTSFEHQLFQRDELARWIKYHGFKSKYEFHIGAESLTPTGRTFPLLSRIKRDILTPVIELAATHCRNPTDVAELWTALQTLARQRTPPLLGVTETGIQYLDSNDAPKEFTKRALRERIRRSA